MKHWMNKKSTLYLLGALSLIVKTVGKIILIIIIDTNAEKEW